MITPVNFKLAKLLKEKGFNEVCQKWYSVEGGLYYQDEFDNNRGFIPVCECEAPTIAEVVMWLLESYKIYIHISPHGQEEDLLEDCRWWFSVYKNKLYNLVGGSKVTKDIEDFGSLTEAYEAAIEYTLKNLLP